MGVISSKGRLDYEAAASRLVAEVRGRKYPEWGLVGRKEELESLIGYMSRQPLGILVLAGPPNSGKSTLLKHLVALFATDPLLAIARPVFRLDRSKGLSDVEAAILFMKRELVNYVENVLQLAKALNLLVSFPTKLGLTTTFKSAIEDARNMASLVNIFYRFLAGGPDVRPTLIIDEAHELKKWSKNDFQTFIGFFTSATKKDHCHLILCSSDDSFISWLWGEIPSNTCTFQGVGPLKIEEARYFFECKLANPAQDDELWSKLPKVDDKNWDDVYELCGGNPVLLETVALKLQENINREDEIIVVPTNEWNKCRTEMLNRELDTVASGLCPSDDSGWTSEQFRKLMELLKDSNHAPMDLVSKTLFHSDGNLARSVIYKMAAEGVIHVRFSPGREDYCDLKLEGKYHRLQIMARSNAHLLAIRQALEDPNIE